MKTRWSISVGIVLLAIAIGLLLGWPQPVLDFDSDIIPLAHEFMGLSEVSSMPLNGLVVVITGATSGIGMSLARALSGMGATVVAIGRSQHKLAQLQKEVTGTVPVVADLNDLSSVAMAADEITKKFEHIDVLINNAGMHYGWKTWGHPTSAQGFDQSFGVNYLSHFLLTEKLLPSLNNSDKATIMQITSSFHWAVSGADLATVEDNPPMASVPGGSSILARDQRAYANSKLAQILHSRALVRQNVTRARVVNVCPGWVGTQIGGRKGTPIHYSLQSLAFPSDGWGIASSLHALFMSTSNGDYFITTKLFSLFGQTFPESFFRPWSTVSHFRDLVCFVVAYFLLVAQKFAPKAFADQSSPESYDVALQDSLYTWSKAAVAKWL